MNKATILKANFKVKMKIKLADGGFKKKTTIKFQNS